jgi:DNA polymerase sigma
MNQFQALEDRVDLLIQSFHATNQSNDVRSKITLYLKSIIEPKIPNALLVSSGSTSSRTYLPDSDLDLVLVIFPKSFAPSSLLISEEMYYLNQTFLALCEEISRKDDNSLPNCASSFPSSAISSVSAPSVLLPPSLSLVPCSDFVIRNVEFINARTKLIHCKINNLGVDITVNQVGALSAVLFLERIDSFIQNSHLFKRSLLLVKVCLSFFSHFLVLQVFVRLGV